MTKHAIAALLLAGAATAYAVVPPMISAVNRRLMELAREGWMLPEYAEDVRADAQAIDITPPGKR